MEKINLLLTVLIYYILSAQTRAFFVSLIFTILLMIIPKVRVLWRVSSLSKCKIRSLKDERTFTATLTAME